MVSSVRRGRRGLGSTGGVDDGGDVDGGDDVGETAAVGLDVGQQSAGIKEIGASAEMGSGTDGHRSQLFEKEHFSVSEHNYQGTLLREEDAYEKLSSVSKKSDGTYHEAGGDALTDAASSIGTFVAGAVFFKETVVLRILVAGVNAARITRKRILSEQAASDDVAKRKQQEGQRAGLMEDARYLASTNAAVGAESVLQTNQTTPTGDDMILRDWIASFEEEPFEGDTPPSEALEQVLMRSAENTDRLEQSATAGLPVPADIQGLFLPELYAEATDSDDMSIEMSSDEEGEAEEEEEEEA